MTVSCTVLFCARLHCKAGAKVAIYWRSQERMCHPSYVHPALDSMYHALLCAIFHCRAGAKVAIFSRSLERIREAAQRIEAEVSGAHVLPLAADVSNKAQALRAVEQTVEAFGGLHVLVANGGGPPPGTFESLAEKDWEEAVQGTLLSTVNLIRAASEHMKVCVRVWGRGG